MDKREKDTLGRYRELFGKIEQLPLDLEYSGKELIAYRDEIEDGDTISDIIERVKASELEKDDKSLIVTYLLAASIIKRKEVSIKTFLRHIQGCEYMGYAVSSYNIDNLPGYGLTEKEGYILRRFLSRYGRY